MGLTGNLFFSTYLHSSSIRFGEKGPTERTTTGSISKGGIKAERQSGNRPLVMPRFAGLGQHRYCCGFSGDTHINSSNWQVTLAAEVNMTKTAANIGFAYWSHDVGGFAGDGGPESMARWMQFGAGT
jgi:alpha-glucosidase (family GH31 glycosyl hydrolase)